MQYVPQSCRKKKQCVSTTCQQYPSTIQQDVKCFCNNKNVLCVQSMVWQFVRHPVFIPILYMFRVPLCSSSGESIVLMWYVVYVTLCRWPSSVQVWMETCTLDGLLHRVTYTRCRINTIDSPDDEHRGARNLWRIGLNIYEKRIVRHVGYLQEFCSFCMDDRTFNVDQEQSKTVPA